MKTRVFLLAALLGGVTLAAAPAQEASQQPQAAVNQTSKAASVADAQAEDIEIMRRLLARALTVGQPKWTTGQFVFPPYVTNDSVWVDLGGGRFNSLDLTAAYQMNANPRLARTLFDSVTTTPTQPLLLDLGAAQTGQYLTFGVHPWSDPHAMPAEMHGPQGVYLKGHGVVYTATVPLGATSAADPKKPAPKPLTDWERTRRELRGEKVEPTKPAAPQESLADAVLKVLAENGGHFSQLGENEQITVALTLTRAKSCTQCHANTFDTPKEGSSSGAKLKGGSSDPTNTRITAFDPLGGAAAKEIMDKINGLKKDAQKAVLLGDLHMKQAKNEQAAASYEEALKLYLDASQLQRRTSLDLTGLPETDKQLDNEVGQTAAKLLQIYIALGKTEELRRTEMIFQTYLQKLMPTEKTAAKPVEASATVELPAKLVISAPKKLLELAGAGKVTAEEFRKAATVEYQPARTIEKPPTKAPGG